MLSILFNKVVHVTFRRSKFDYIHKDVTIFTQGLLHEDVTIFTERLWTTQRRNNIYRRPPTQRRNNIYRTAPKQRRNNIRVWLYLATQERGEKYRQMKPPFEL